jgi:hypothetical protein
MAAIQVHTRPSGPQTNGVVADGCAVCPHAWTAHDAISARFCNATVAGQFERGCACAAGMPSGKTG